MSIKFSFKSIAFISILYSPVIALIMEMLIKNSFSKYIFIMLLLMYVLFVSEQIKTKKYISTAIVSFVLLVIATINVMRYGVKDLSNADLYSYLFLIILLLAFQKKDIIFEFQRYIERSEKLILITSFLFYIVSSIYQVLKYSEITYIKGPFLYSHVFAYYCLAYYALMICLSNNKSNYKRWIIILKIVSVIMVLLSAVRSASLAMVVILFFDYFKIRSFSIKTILLIALVGLAVYFVYFTDIIYSIPLIRKTLLAIDNGDISNGRENFANNILDFYQGLPFSDKFFGVGITSIRNYMFTIYHVGIHAHNDFVNILCGYGLLGLGLFFYSAIKYSSDTKKLWIFLVLFLLAYFNGLFMYSGFCLLLPVIKVAFLKSSYEKSFRLSIKVR